MARQLARQRGSAWPEASVEEEERWSGYGNRSDDDDDYDDDRPRRPRRSRDEDYDDEPRRPRRSRDEDDYDERPRRSRSRDEDERPRRPRDEDEERPRRGRSSSRDDGRRPSASVGSGWDTLQDERAKRAGSAHRLNVKDKQVIIKFLEPEPFAVYNQHWVAQRSYSCPEPKEDCPLCARGYDTRTLALFNVVDIASGENLYWECGPNAAKKVKEKADKPPTKPINKPDLYFAVSRAKQDNGFYDFTVTHIKERDLEDDYNGLLPLDERELAEAERSMFDSSVIQYHSPRELREVANNDDD